METIDNNKGYEVRVEEDGKTHIYCEQKDNTIKDYVLEPGENKIQIKGFQITLDCPEINSDTSYLAVGNGSDGGGKGNYLEGSRTVEIEGSNRVYAYMVESGKTSTNHYGVMLDLFDDIAEANGVENPVKATLGFSASGTESYKYARDTEGVHTCLLVDPVSWSNTKEYNSGDDVYTLALVNAGAGDRDKGEDWVQMRDKYQTKNTLIINLVRNRDGNHGEKTLKLMDQYGLTNFVDSHLNINEIDEKIGIKHYYVYIDENGVIHDHCDLETVQKFLDDAYETTLASKSEVKSPKTGENTRELNDQEKELLLLLSNIDKLKTSDKYEDGLISTKYQSVVDGINNVRDVLKYTDVSTKNPGLNGNQDLNNKLSGFLGCLAYVSNSILADTKNLTDSFGCLLQDYSYLEFGLNKSVQEIGEMNFSSVMTLKANDLSGLDGSLLQNFEGYKSAYDEKYDISKLRVGSVSSSELDALLSDNGAIKTFFGSEIENSNDLITKIDTLLSSETQGPGWEEAKIVLLSLKRNVEIRLKTSKYTEGRLSEIYSKLKDYIDKNAGASGYISDENLDSLVSQAAQLSREIMLLSMKIALMPDILWIDEKGQPVANYEKEMLAQELHAKEAALNEINRQISIIEGYRKLVQQCMMETNELLGEISTSKSYYGGLIDIPDINVSNLEYLNGLF